MAANFSTIFFFSHQKNPGRWTMVLRYFCPQTAVVDRGSTSSITNNVISLLSSIHLSSDFVGISLFLSLEHYRVAEFFTEGTVDHKKTSHCTGDPFVSVPRPFDLEYSLTIPFVVDLGTTSCSLLVDSQR